MFENLFFSSSEEVSLFNIGHLDFPCLFDRSNFRIITNNNDVAGIQLTVRINNVHTIKSCRRCWKCSSSMKKVKGGFCKMAATQLNLNNNNNDDFNSAVTWMAQCHYKGAYLVEQRHVRST